MRTDDQLRDRIDDFRVRVVGCRENAEKLNRDQLIDLVVELTEFALSASEKIWIMSAHLSRLAERNVQ